MKKSLTIVSQMLLIGFLGLFTNQSIAQTKSKTMKLTNSQSAPNFTIKDINGNIVTLNDFKGKKVLLSFYRNVGCPVCNLRFHELQNHASYFKSKQVIVLAVYESSEQNMKSYIGDSTFYASMIPNPDESLYKLYNVERSMGKVMKGMFHGLMKKKSAGEKLFKKPMKQDGNMNRIEADFLIDENGKIIISKYGDFIGDHIPLDELKKVIN